MTPDESAWVAFMAGSLTSKTPHASSEYADYALAILRARRASGAFGGPQPRIDRYTADMQDAGKETGPQAPRPSEMAAVETDAARADRLNLMLGLMCDERDAGLEELRGATRRIESLIRERDSALLEQGEQRTRAEAAESLERTAKDRRADVEAILKEALGPLDFARVRLEFHLGRNGMAGDQEGVNRIESVLAKAKAAGYLP